MAVTVDPKDVDKMLKGLVKVVKTTNANIASKTEYKGEVFSTGSPILDNSLGTGGIPLGKILEVYGNASSGKSTLCYLIMAHAQRQGIIPFFVDMEGWQRDWASRVGLNPDLLIVSQPDSLEQGFKEIKAMIENGCKLIVLDSLAQAPTESQLKGEVGDHHVGVKARIMSERMPVIQNILAKHGATLIIINQVREKIGVMYGNPETTPGGRALEFACAMRLKVHAKPIRVSQEHIGNEVTITSVKNKLAAPNKKAMMKLYFTSGFDVQREMVTIGTQLGLITKAGGWYTTQYRGEGNDLKVQGEENLVSALEEIPGALDELERLVRDKLQKGELALEAEDAEDADDDTDF